MVAFAYRQLRMIRKGELVRKLVGGMGGGSLIDVALGTTETIDGQN